jgi:hypothetical protein
MSVFPMMCCHVHFGGTEPSFHVRVDHWPSAWPVTDRITLQLGRWQQHAVPAVFQPTPARQTKRSRTQPLPLIQIPANGPLRILENQTMRLHLRYEPQTGHMHIGPFVCILSHDQRLQRSPFAQQIGQECSRQAIGLHWSTDPAELPPWIDVIYNRIGLRRIEQTEAFQRQIQQWQQTAGLKIFNTRFLDKLEVDALLASDAELSRHLIPSTAFPMGTSASVIRQHLASDLPKQKENALFFVKPAKGSGGRGIWRIRHTNRRPKRDRMAHQEKSSAWIVEHTAAPSSAALPTYQARTLSSEQLSRALAKRSIKDGLLWQTAIRSALWQGKPFDLRILVQKNGRNEWIVSSAVARVAAKSHHWLCNVQQGASVHAASVVIGQAQSLAAKQLAVQIARSLEQRLNWHNPPAEFGIDLIFSSSDQFYVLEVNAKPSKMLPDADGHLNSNLPIPRSIRTWAQYVRYASGMYEPITRNKKRPRGKLSTKRASITTDLSKRTLQKSKSTQKGRPHR